MERYVRFNINGKSTFIDSFQFLNPLVFSLVKNLHQDDFKYLSHKVDSKVVHIGKQKGFHPYECMSGFEKFKERLLTFLIKKSNVLYYENLQHCFRLGSKLKKRHRVLEFSYSQ